MARAMTVKSSLMSVGRKAVVPKRRCAAPIVRMVATLGSSFKSAPPPPLTWQSMNPGTRYAPPRS